MRLLASKVGLTTELATALRRKRSTPVHDRGQMITDLAVTIADGGVAISNLAPWTIRANDAAPRP